MNYRNLNMWEMFSLLTGWSAEDRLTTRFKNPEECREAWEENQEMFLRVCMCPDDHRRACGVHPYGHQPGQRPWAWWRFEAGMDRPNIFHADYEKRYGVRWPEIVDEHEIQFPVLEKLGVIGAEERRLFLQRQEVRRCEREEREAFLDSLGKNSKIEQTESLRPN